MIKNMVFDMGNVLLHFSPSHYVKNLGLENAEDEKKVFNATYLTWKCAYLDKGDFTEESFVDAVCEDIGEKYRPYIEKLIFHWADDVKPVDGMADLIKELKDKGYKIYLLSNAGFRQHEYWERIPGHEYFDGTIVSCDVKAVKPERRIYEKLYETFNLKPEECFFIDDLIINIYGAKETGMDGFVFRNDIDDLRNELKKRNIL